MNVEFRSSFLKDIRALKDKSIHARITELIQLAQIIPDRTLGAEGSHLTPNVQIKGAAAERIDGGAQRASNLFHSFSQFNIDAGQRVYFANPTGVQNILTRVTRHI